MIGADKGGLNVMLGTAQASYKFTKQICEVLGLELPMVENPAVEPDELDRTVADLRGLPPEEVADMLPQIRMMIDAAKRRSQRHRRDS